MDHVAVPVVGHVGDIAGACPALRTAYLQYPPSSNGAHGTSPQPTAPNGVGWCGTCWVNTQHIAAGFAPVARPRPSCACSMHHQSDGIVHHATIEPSFRWLMLYPGSAAQGSLAGQWRQHACCPTDACTGAGAHRDSTADANGKHANAGTGTGTGACDAASSCSSAATAAPSAFVPTAT